MDTGSSREEQSESDHIETLLHRDVYSPEEAAEVSGIPLRTIRSAAFRGDLKAVIVGHDIVSIERGDLLAWLQDRD